MAKLLPSNFLKFPLASIMGKAEHERVALNIMIILNKNGNTWRKLSWKEYVKSRTDDEVKKLDEIGEDFPNRSLYIRHNIDSEKSYFKSVVEHCSSANKALKFSENWLIE